MDFKCQEIGIAPYKSFENCEPGQHDLYNKTFKGAGRKATDVIISKTSCSNLFTVQYTLQIDF